MDEETKKEIELKNLIDICIENLRINNQEKNEKSEGFKVLTEDDVNIEQLIFRNPEIGSKILGKVRKTLHREIRDWSIQPLQKKQTLLNRKINDNLSNIFLEIQSLQNKIEPVKYKVESNKNTILSVKGKLDMVL